MEKAGRSHEVMEGGWHRAMIGSLSLERSLPAGLGVIAMIASVTLGLALPDDAKREILTATISVGAILAGFLGTTKAILMSLPPSGLPSKLRSSGYMTDLARYLAEALLGAMALCAVSIVGLFPVESLYPVIFCAVWAGLSVYALTGFWRVSRIMLSILQLDPNRL